VKKEYVQYGKSMIVILVVVMIACLVMFLTLGMKEPLPAGIIIFVGATFALTLLSFYKLTITIDDTYLSFSLGIGLIRKSYLLSDIKSCTSVKNPLLSGIGIHMVSGGWLYNVSGPYAIKLTFKNNTSEVRIGSDVPDEIALELMSRLGKQGSQYAGEARRRKGFNIFVIILPFIIFGAIGLVIYGGRDTKYSFGADNFSISGMYGLTIGYRDIAEADTITRMPDIRLRTNGFEAGNVLKGHFRLSDGENVLLFICNNNPPFVRIKTIGKVIYLNGNIPEETRKLYMSVLKTRNQDK
jgi:hypothetical protein